MKIVSLFYFFVCLSAQAMSGDLTMVELRAEADRERVASIVLAARTFVKNNSTEEDQKAWNKHWDRMLAERIESEDTCNVDKFLRDKCLEKLSWLSAFNTAKTAEEIKCTHEQKLEACRIILFASRVRGALPEAVLNFMKDEKKSALVAAFIERQIASKQ